MSDKGKQSGGYETNKGWQVGMEVAAEIYRFTAQLPDDEKYGLSSQLRRAAVSIPSNIAEGNANGSDGIYLRHVRIARGSVAEVETQLRLVDRLELVPGGVPDALLHRVDRLARIISGLRSYLQTKTAS